jgi:hypothetical protein
MSHLRVVAPDPVLARWFDGGRLKAIPVKRGKRLPVLSRLAQEFEPGVYYSEADVNATLRAFHPDVAALRRYLVEEGFMSRTPGGFSYWRTGGEFQLSE